MSVVVKDIQELSGAELMELADAIRKTSSTKPFETYKEELMIVLNEVNRRGELIAKKHKKTYRKISFAEFR